jgi:hypothetical protein
VIALRRDVLTLDLLIEEHGEEQEWIDDRATLDRSDARFDAMKAALGRLPDGFVVERVQGRVGPGRDPGCEMCLIDERFSPPRLVGKVSRRLIGQQRVGWTGVQLVDPTAARAFAAVLEVAAADGEGRAS